MVDCSVEDWSCPVVVETLEVAIDDFEHSPSVGGHCSELGWFVSEHDDMGVGVDTHAALVLAGEETAVFDLFHGWVLEVSEALPWDIVDDETDA